MTRFVTIDADDPIPDLARCIACNSTNLQIVISEQPVVDYLTPVRGQPYPTFHAFMHVTGDFTCRDCGVHYAQVEGSEDPVPPELLPYDTYTHKRIDKLAEDDLLGLP